MDWLLWIFLALLFFTDLLGINFIGL